MFCVECSCKTDLMDEESFILGDGTLPQQQGASSGLVPQDTVTVQWNVTTLTCWQMKIPR